jgi:hypothetical protein
MSEILWQQSGLDGRQHAFTAHDGYVTAQPYTAYVQFSSIVAGEDVYAAHPVEVYVSECDHVVPVAFMMPRSTGTTGVRCCVDCLRCTDESRPSLRLAHTMAERSVTYRPGVMSRL